MISARKMSRVGEITKVTLIQKTLLAGGILWNDWRKTTTAWRNASIVVMIIVVDLAQRCYYDELVRHSHFSCNNPYQNTLEITVVVIIIRYCNNRSYCCCC